MGQVKINPAARLLLASCYVAETDLSALRAAGLRGFLRKPLDLQRLGEAVRDALDGNE